MKKVPMRTCVITREKLPKKDLLRIVKDKEGNISVDLTGKLNGHGVYIKKDMEVLNTLKKKKSLERLFEVNDIDEELYNEIEKIIQNF